MKIEELGIALLEEHPIAFHAILARIGGLCLWRGHEKQN